MAHAPRLSFIAAIAENGVIGCAEGLPWRLSSDHKRFRKLTMGHPLIMGRHTYESIGKPLGGRDNIVVTRTGLQRSHEGVYQAASLDEALALAATQAEVRGVGEIFIIGGAMLYSQALPLASRIYLTRVHGRPKGDTFWEPDLSDWAELSRSSRPASERDEFPVTDLVLERRGA
jgi:dihydrofolate reductase